MTTSHSAGPRRLRRAASALLAGGGLVAATLVFVQPAAQADSDPVDPQNPASPTTVTADRLPTVQMDGVVWEQAIAGDRVYAGGAFGSARPAGSNPGQNEVTRNNLLAYDLETGNLISSFSPNLDAEVTAVAVSPDESRVYVGGYFSEIDGGTKHRLAAFDAETGQLISSFGARFYGSVDAIVATNSTVYVGGSFSIEGADGLANLAALDAASGAVLDWAPQAAGNPAATVSALAMKPDESAIAVGGSFTTLNGDDDPGYGLGMVDATTGESLPFGANDIVRNGTSAGAITTLSADEDHVYGGGYTYGKQGGTLEGVFAADWDGGDLHWINDCHGDTYGVHPQGDVIYQAGHFHYCENIGGFHQGDGGVGSYPYNRGTAMSKAATGTATWEPDQGRYHSFEGEPTPSQLAWWPSMSAGEASGQNQGPWNVTGNDDYVLMGGEFTRVNGQAQQGLVRYALKGEAPNDRGPQLSGSNYPIKATSQTAGKVDISWAANHDQDNENLTYRVYRDTQNAAGLVHTRDLATPYWNLPGMGFADTVAPGSNHQYRVSATDSSGNVANSPWVSVTAATSGTISAYERAVRDSEPTHYWRLGEASGTGVGDTTGWAPQTARAGVTRNVPGAIAGDSDRAARFSGTTSGYSATGSTADPPDVFTLEAWFKGGANTAGKIVGWGNRNDRNSSKNDRHLYMDGTGRIRFGVKPNASRVSVVSGRTYRDNQWHHAVASLGENGMRLYVDGAQVAQNADVTAGEHLSRGFWRIGGDSLSSWHSAPTSPFFNGSIDEVAMYRSVLSLSEVAAHYAAGANGQPRNVAPKAEFTSSTNGLELSVDGSGSSDSDGSVESYAWDFGDRSSGTGTNASHTYHSAGTYDVALTVTDDEGATDTATEQVTVEADDPDPDPDPPEQIAADQFQRTVTGAWGNADTGGSWTRTGSAGTYQVDGAVGRMTTSGAGNGKAAYLGGLSAAEADSTIDLTLNKKPAGGAAFLSYSGRRIDGNNKYSAMVRHLADGTVNLSLRKLVDGTETNLGHTKVDSLTPAANDKLRLRFQVAGASPTRLRAKLWAVGDDQPQDWQLDAGDDAATLQGEGAVGVDMYLGGALTNAPVTAGFDNLKVLEPGEEPDEPEKPQPEPGNQRPDAKPLAAAIVVNKPVLLTPRISDPDRDKVVAWLGERPKHGTARLVRNRTRIRYTPRNRFVGTDTLYYRAREKNKPNKVSTRVKVTVRVRKAKATIGRTAVLPKKLTPRKRGRVTTVIRTPRTWPGAAVAVRKGARVLGRAHPNRSTGVVRVPLKKLARGLHTLRVRYTGGPVTKVAVKSVRVRVRRP